MSNNKSILLAIMFSVTSFAVGFYTNGKPEAIIGAEGKVIFPEEFVLSEEGDFIRVEKVWRNKDNHLKLDSIQLGFVTETSIWIPHPYLKQIKLDFMRKEIYIKSQGKVLTGFRNNIDISNWFRFNYNPQHYGQPE